jgi:hypothetical protein
MPPSASPAAVSAPESGAPPSELLPELASIAEPPPLDEVDAGPDPLPDEDELEPLPEPPPGEEDDEGVPPPELPLLELGLALGPLPLPDPPVEDAEVASIAPPSSVELPLAPVVPTFPPQAAPPSWPKAVTTTEAMID